MRIATCVAFVNRRSPAAVSSILKIRLLSGSGRRMIAPSFSSGAISSVIDCGSMPIARASSAEELAPPVLIRNRMKYWLGVRSTSVKAPSMQPRTASSARFNR